MEPGRDGHGPPPRPARVGRRRGRRAVRAPTASRTSPSPRSTRRATHETWWRASFRVLNPATPYRWLLSGGAVGYGWVTGEGLVGHDVPDSDDFVCAVGDDGPALARRRRRVPGLSRPLRPLGGRANAARLGGAARLGRHPDRVGARHAARVVRRRPRRGRGAPRPPRAARRLDSLPDAVLPGPLDAPLQRDVVRPRRPAARRRRGARVARARRPCTRDPRRSATSRSTTSATTIPGSSAHGDARRPRAALLLVRRAPRARLRGVGRRPHAAEARPPRRGAPPPPARRRRGRRPALAASAVRPRRLAARRCEHGRAARRGRRRPGARARGARRRARRAGRRGPRRGARPRRAPRPPGRRLARDDGLHGLHAARMGLAPRRRPAGGAPARLPRPARRGAAPRRPRGDRHDAALPRRDPVALRPLELGPARQPRHRAVPGRERLARAPRRRDRAPDDDPWRPDGVRGRRARAGGRLGRGRAAHDALGPARDLGPRAARGVPHADRPPPVVACARPRRDPLRARRDATRSPTSARRGTSGCSASRCARRPTTCAFRSPRSARPGCEPLFGAEARVDAGAAVLPGDGPAFHVWRLR